MFPKNLSVLLQPTQNPNTLTSVFQSFTHNNNNLGQEGTAQPNELSANSSEDVSDLDDDLESHEEINRILSLTNPKQLEAHLWLAK